MSKATTSNVKYTGITSYLGATLHEHFIAVDDAMRNFDVVEVRTSKDINGQLYSSVGYIVGNDLLTEGSKPTQSFTEAQIRDFLLTTYTEYKQSYCFICEEPFVDGDEVKSMRTGNKVHGNGRECQPQTKAGFDGYINYLRNLK